MEGIGTAQVVAGVRRKQATRHFRFPAQPLVLAASALAVVALAFTGLFAMFRNGSPAVSIGSGTASSPAGGGVGQVAFVADLSDDTGEYIYTMNPDGTQLTQIAGPLSTAWLSWKPDGTRLAFDQRLSDGSEELDVMNADGTGTARIASATANHMSWSPDGTRIAFVSGEGRVKVVNADSSGMRELVDPGANCGVDRVAWSPDSSKVAFAKECTSGGQTGIYTITLKDGAVVRLLSGVDSGEGNVEPGNADSYVGLSWSPDSTRIVFASFTPDGAATVYLMNADGSNLRSLTNGTEPVWSPEGKTIALLANGTIEYVTPAGEPAGSPNLPPTIQPSSIAW